MRAKPVWLIAFLVSACQAPASVVNSRGNPAALSEPAAAAIAGEMASRLVEQLPPATAPLRLQGEEGEFTEALKTSLQSWGYRISGDAVAKDRAQQQPLPLTFGLQDVEGQFLAHVSIGSLTLARAYVPTSTGASPASPLTILRTR